MRSLVRPLFASLLLLAGLVAPATADVSDAAAATRAIVSFSGDTLPDSLASDLEALGIEDAVAFETINAVAVTAPARAIDALAADARVEAIRGERRLHIDLYQSVEMMGAQGVENPERYDLRGNRTALRPGVTGAGQSVAVLDTGIWSEHPDLVGQVTMHRNFELAYGVNALSAEALDEYARTTGAANTTDDIGHGTHVGGTVAGTGYASSGRENHGVAPGAKLVDLRIAAGPVQGLVEDTGWERNAIAAFDWLVRHHDDEVFGANGIRVNTNSWGLTGSDLIYGKPDYDPLAEVIERVRDEGVVTVFSAGNDGVEDDVTDDTVPNGLPGVLSVAAACKDDATTSGCDASTPGDIADFSSRGPAVDLGAPGVEIVAPVQPASIVGALSKSGVYGGHYGDTPEDEVVNRAAYGAASGTSMAAPHAAGFAALVLQVNPELTEAEVREIMVATADARSEPDPSRNAWGAGFTDVDQALIVAHRMAHGESLEQALRATS